MRVFADLVFERAQVSALALSFCRTLVLRPFLPVGRMDFDWPVRFCINKRQAHPSAREYKRMNLALLDDGKAHIARFGNVR